MLRFAPLSWDYTSLSGTYDFRADYCQELVHEVLKGLDLQAGDPTLDVGAGTGKLSGLLCEYGLDVVALEPNASMRSVALTKPTLRRAHWLAARGESLPLRQNSMTLVAYGSSFNVMPARPALDECARVLRAGGHWLALWNHRDLGDPLQQSVEALIRRHIPDYDYGRRRISPKSDLAAHGAFSDIEAAEQRFIVEIPARDWVSAWRSHATLQRQAGLCLPAILNELQALVGTTGRLRIPYFTRVWTALRKPG
jgi:ubiquinone/menaquinone biosynthesis C-methylase UbiE